MSLGSLLLAYGFITAEQLQTAVDYQHDHASQRLGEIVVALGFASEAAINTCLAKQKQLRHN